MTDHQVEKCGYLAIIGRPNVGKSTLFNALLGHSVSVVTRKAQTTQTEIMGVVTASPYQYVLLDTPGVQCRLKRRTMLNRVAAKSAFEADVAIFMAAGSQWTDDDDAALKILDDFDGPVIGCINKLDKLVNQPNKLAQAVENLQNRFTFVQIMTLSALRHYHVDLMHAEICSYLPDGPALYDAGMVTTHSDAFISQEILRAKLLELLHEEIPYEIELTIDLMKTVKDKRHIYMTIWVSSSTKKAVVIGKGGSKIKQIGIQSRREMEQYFKQPIVLKTWVKVGTPPSTITN